MSAEIKEAPSKQDTSIDKLKRLPIIGEQPRSKKEEDYLREIEEYEFVNLEEPGLSQRFSYGDSKFSHRFNLEHGGKYKLPRFVARHLESRTIPIWNWRPNGEGGMEKKEMGSQQRFQLRQVFSR